MMGTSHALTGVLAAVVVARYVHADVPSGVLLISTLPGFALLPDVDHGAATVSNTYGFLTRTFSYVLGHRRETHSVPGIAAFAGLVQLAVHAEEPRTLLPYVLFVLGKILLTFVLILCWAATIRLFKIPGIWDDLLPIPISVMIVWAPQWFLVVGIGVDLRYLSAAVALGMLVHLLGDVVTMQGCPLWWPLSSRRTAFRIFRAGSSFEKWIMVPMITITIMVFTWQWITGMS
jgi:membrane-bound metal-dependent hydrolase YbcI (DUF457 family)